MATFNLSKFGINRFAKNIFKHFVCEKQVMNDTTLH